MIAIDSGEFRNALGRFATGVTIVTTTEVNFEACDHEPLWFHRGSFARVHSNESLLDPG